MRSVVVRRCPSMTQSVLSAMRAHVFLLLLLIIIIIIIFFFVFWRPASRPCNSRRVPWLLAVRRCPTTTQSVLSAMRAHVFLLLLIIIIIIIIIIFFFFFFWRPASRPWNSRCGRWQSVDDTVCTVSDESACDFSVQSCKHTGAHRCRNDGLLFGFEQDVAL